MVKSTLALRSICTFVSNLNGSKLHGIIGNALIKYALGGFILVIFLVPEAAPELVLSLEQAVLDNCVCAYNINPTAGSLLGFKHSDETKAKMSDAKRGEANPQFGEPLSEEHKVKISASNKGRQQGAKNPNFNKGKTVYLYLVNGHGFELAALFPNTVRCSEALDIPFKTLFNRIQNRTLFKVKGVPHIL